MRGRFEVQPFFYTLDFGTSIVMSSTCVPGTCLSLFPVPISRREGRLVCWSVPLSACTPSHGLSGTRCSQCNILSINSTLPSATPPPDTLLCVAPDLQQKVEGYDEADTRHTHSQPGNEQAKRGFRLIFMNHMS